MGDWVWDWFGCVMVVVLRVGGMGLFGCCVVVGGVWKVVRLLWCGGGEGEV